MSKYFYSSESARGTSSSFGFCDDTIVRVFDSKESRDAFVTDTPNISARKIRRNQVTVMATNETTIGNSNAPAPFTGDYWGIYKNDEGEYFAPGQIGIVVVVRDGNIDNHDLCKMERLFN